MFSGCSQSMTRRRSVFWPPCSRSGIDGDAVLEEAVDFAVRSFEAHRGAVAGQLVDGGFDGLGWEDRVETGECGPQAVDKNHFALGFAAQRAVRAERLVHCRHRLPTERGEQADGGLLDELIFGVGTEYGQGCLSFRLGREKTRDQQVASMTQVSGLVLQCLDLVKHRLHSLIKLGNH